MTPGRIWFVSAANIGQVIEFELALLTPEVRRSKCRLEGLLDPDFRDIGTSGRLWSRAEMIATLSSGGDDVREPIQAVDIIGTSLGPDLVLLTHMSTRKGVQHAAVPCGDGPRRLGDYFTTRAPCSLTSDCVSIADPARRS